VERRRDPDAAPSARGGPARATEGSFAADVAGPGAAGPAHRDTASRVPGRVAADGDPGHDRALAPRHRPPPLGAAVRQGRSGRLPVRRAVRSLVLRLARAGRSSCVPRLRRSAQPHERNHYGAGSGQLGQRSPDLRCPLVWPDRDRSRNQQRRQPLRWHSQGESASRVGRLPALSAKEFCGDPVYACFRHNPQPRQYFVTLQ